MATSPSQASASAARATTHSASPPSLFPAPPPSQDSSPTTLPTSPPRTQSVLWVSGPTKSTLFPTLGTLPSGSTEQLVCLLPTPTILPVCQTEGSSSPPVSPLHPAF